MPRPPKCRKVCKLPDTDEFRPAGCQGKSKCITLTIDEYEAVRLLDKEGFSQEECGKYMNVSRATVQEIYTGARKKIAEALVDSKTLKIKGGAYKICDGTEKSCRCNGCAKHRNVR